MEGYQFYKGEYSQLNDSSPLTIHSVHYASSVFDGIRIYKQKPFLLKRHIDRLIKSAKYSVLSLSYTEIEIFEICDELIKKSGYEDAYLRIIIFDSGPNLGILGPENTTQFGAVLWEWPSVFGQDSIALTTDVQYCRPRSDMFPTDAKTSSSYLISRITRSQAISKGYDDSLLFCHDGSIAETSGSNIFFVIDSKLVTPKVDGFLNGITRQIVLELIEESGLQFEERKIWLDELTNVSEVFLTGTAYEILPVTKINNLHYHIGEISMKLKASYRKLVHEYSGSYLNEVN